jgi:formate-dependent nitrite reductase cytochrome c552 subunit
MTTVNTDQLSETIHGLKDAATNALSNQSTDDFEAFERYLSEVEAYAREIQQSLWVNEARATIRRLEKGEPLHNTDHELLRTFLVSDAQAYLKNENNFQDWVRELQRLIDDLDVRVNTVDRQSIADLRGLLKDAIRLVPDIRNYLDEQRRVERFEQSLQSLDADSRKLLLRLLQDQLRNANR